MNTIGCIKFDFEMENESFAQKLYGQWDQFFATSFEQIADELLTKYDVNSEQIEIKELELNLGSLSEEEFYEKFPVLIRERLEEALILLLYHPHQLGVKRLSKADDNFDILCQFLLHGRLSWSTSSKKTSICELFWNVLETNSKRLKQFLQTYGHYSSLQERLVYQLNDKELEQGVHLLAPQESVFICSYTHFLKAKYKQLQQVTIRETRHRDLVWTVVYAYLLNNRASYFDKKSFLAYTLMQLASKYNLSYAYLLDIITSELNVFTNQLHSPPLLFVLLSELRKELVDKDFKKSATNVARLYKIIAKSIVEDCANTIHKDTYAVLVNMLSRTDSCRIFIAQLSEKEIISLVPIVSPNESEFVINYAHSLDVQKEKGGLDGKAGGEFRLLKWQLIFPLLLQNGGSSFSRKQFVIGVLKQITAHYNLDLFKLIEFIWRESEIMKIDRQLAQILQSLYREQRAEQEHVLQQTLSPTTHEMLECLIRSTKTATADQQKGLMKALENNIFRQKTIDKLNEDEIQQLTILVFPHESSFICAYARSLEHQKAYGALQGRTGGEFHKLKWIFIFHVLTENKQNVFDRPYFVATVLRQIAAHYNLTYFELLEAFQNEKLNISLPFGLDQILNELYQQELKIVIDQLLIGSREEDKRRFLESLAPHEKEFIINYIKLLNRTTQHTVLVTKVGGNFQQLKWQFIFAILLEMPGSSFNRKYFVRKTLESIAAHYNLKVADLIRYYTQEIKLLNIDSQFNLTTILDELYREQAGVKSKNIDQKNSEPTDKKEKLAYSDSAEGDDKLTESMFVNNAGLVLLAPFMPRLFENLSLLVDNRFRDEEAQQTALFLLQYAVFEQTEFAEHELFLNKLVVGYKAGRPIPRTGELTDEHKAMVTSLLQGVLQHWEKLRSTSVSGLRESFLQREGKLEESTDFWLLTIETKAFDMLLDSLPWSYAIIKHPWMVKAIHIKWRNN